MGESNCELVVSLGIESSANKVGVGIVTSEGKILANVKRTFVGPPVSCLDETDILPHSAEFTLSLGVWISAQRDGRFSQEQYIGVS